MVSPERAELRRVVVRRSDVLRAIGTDGVSKRDLEDRVDVSRSTVDRSIRELESNRLIERTNGAFRRTLAGELSLREYDAFVSRMDGLADNADLLESLPSDTDVDAAVFDGADVVRSTPHAPQAPVAELCAFIERADRLRGLCFTAFPRGMDAYRSALERGVETELVLARPAVERFVSAFDTASPPLETDHLTIRQATTEPEYGLLLAETPDAPVAGMTLYDDGGVSAFLSNDDTEAVSWARARLVDAREHSVPLPDPP